MAKLYGFAIFVNLVLLCNLRNVKNSMKSQFILCDFRQNLLALVFKLEVSLQVFVYGVSLNVIFHDVDFAALHGFVEQVEGGVE